MRAEIQKKQQKGWKIKMRKSPIGRKKGKDGNESFMPVDMLSQLIDLALKN